jgi:hypothetical protein
LRFLSVTLAFLLCVFLISPGASAEFDREGWAWKTEITPPQGTESYLSLPLEGPIFDSLLTPPHDLRLVDPGGALVPHAIRCGRTAEANETVTRPVRVLNRTYRPYRFSRVVLDFGESAVKNRVKVELTGTNYRRKALVEGGNDGVQWERVADGLVLFDVSGPDKSTTIDTLAFPENNFRYLRLTVENMADDLERVKIVSVAAFHLVYKGGPQLVRVEIVHQKITQDKKTEATVIELDLGFRNLPLHDVTLDIEDAFFHRSYAVDGRQTITHKVHRRTEEAWRAEEVETRWKPVSKGGFYRRQDQGKATEATTAMLSRVFYRHLRITVENHDDAPLRIGRVTVRRQTCGLVFARGSATHYVLYGGNARAGAPSYDFDRRTAGLDISILPMATRSGIERLQPAETKIPWSERYWYVMTGGVVVAVALMLWFILPALRRERSAGKGP